MLSTEGFHTSTVFTVRLCDAFAQIIHRARNHITSQLPSSMLMHLLILVMCIQLSLQTVCTDSNSYRDTTPDLPQVRFIHCLIVLHDLKKLNTYTRGWLHKLRLLQVIFFFSLRLFVFITFVLRQLHKNI